MNTRRKHFDAYEAAKEAMDKVHLVHSTHYMERDNAVLCVQHSIIGEILFPVRSIRFAQIALEVVVTQGMKRQISDYGVILGVHWRDGGDKAEVYAVVQSVATTLVMIKGKVVKRKDRNLLTVISLEDYVQEAVLNSYLPEGD